MVPFHRLDILYLTERCMFRSLPMISIGIDIGARTIKIVLFDTESNRIEDFRIADIGSSPIQNTLSLLEIMQRSSPCDPNQNPIVVTGYGRKHFPLPNRTITEITCQARGTHHLFPETGTIIDIGGQDSKVIRKNSDGRVEDFLMNDRCAAGTGRFLEMASRILEIPLAESGAFGLRASRAVEISSMCAVFAESEIVGLLTQGHSKEEILLGVFHAVARRVAAQASGIGIREPVVFTGGAALNQGLVIELEKELRLPLQIPPCPQITAALGAALLAIPKTHPKPEDKP
jgi:predicted CoA-substrate-specific enzyme activase